MNYSLMRLIAFCVFLLLVSCQPSPLVTPLPDTDYFPLQTGHYRVYSVTEEIYRTGQPVLNRQYERRETVGAAFQTFSGDTAYAVTYAHRLGTGDWQTDSLGAARRRGNDCLLTTGGQTIVKLTFPAFDRQRWDGNRYNTHGPDDFTLQHCHQPFRTGNKAFARTITVVQQNDSTLVSQDKRVEVYAYQVGLVYAERQQVRFCATDPRCGQPTAIAYGIREFIRLTDYGKE